MDSMLDPDFARRLRFVPADEAIDSLIFLQLAFHDLSFCKGQFIGKLEMALVAIVLWALVERLARQGGGPILAETG